MLYRELQPEKSGGKKSYASVTDPLLWVSDLGCNITGWKLFQVEESHRFCYEGVKVVKQGTEVS